MTSLIIDGSTHGLPHAPAYYAMFPREPSPAGNMAFDSKTTTVIKKPMSLELLLETINAPNVQSEVMIVCHAYKDGFYMPLTKSSNDVWADPSAIKLIERADAVARKADVINNLPEITDAEKASKVKAFEEIVRSLGSTLQGTYTLVELKEFFDREFRSLLLEPLKIGTPNRAKEFMDLVRSVQQKKLERVELRACHLGKNVTAMKDFKRLFGCKRFLAPAAETFFAQVPIIGTNILLPRASPQLANNRIRGTTRNQGPTGIEIENHLGNHLKGISHENAPTRTFWVSRVSNSNQTRIPATLGSTAQLSAKLIMTISIWELLGKAGERTYKYGCRVFGATSSDGTTVDWSYIREFVEAMIMPSSNYANGNIILSGFWIPESQQSGWVPWTWIFPKSNSPPFNASAGPFLFANESKYLKLIQEV